MAFAQPGQQSDFGKVIGNVGNTIAQIAHGFTRDFFKQGIQDYLLKAQQPTVTQQPDFKSVIFRQAQDFSRDFQTRIEPVKNYIQDVASFAGIGPLTEEAARRRQVFSQSPFAKTTPEEMALNFSPMGYTKVGAKIGQTALKGLFEEGQNILNTLPKEARLQHIIGYGNELLRAGFTKPQIDQIGARRAATILKKGLRPFDVFGSEPFIQGLKRNTPPNINVDAATTQRAETIGAVSEGKVGGLDDATRTAYQDWVNSRRATVTEGLIKKKEFQDLDSKGLQGIFEFQAKTVAGIKNPRFQDVANYFDTKFTQREQTGVNFGYREDYLPQLWANSKDEIQRVFGRGFTTKPAFSLSRIIEDYKTGVDAGLTPKFNNISQLVGWYEQRFNKTVADFGFFDHLRKDGLIMPSGKAPFGWQTLNPDKFPKYKVTFDNKSYIGTYSAPEELAGMINNYLNDPNGKLEAVANFASTIKNRLLSFGIPKTAINFHGFNILSRHTIFGTGGNPVTRFLTGAKYMINPGLAEAELNQTLSAAPQAIKNGLTVSTEDHLALSNEGQKFATRFGKKWNELFEVPLFNKMIPALKLSSYDELVKNGMETKDAAKMVNNVYGGINWEQMGRNKDIQNLFRSIALTPDWLESTLRLGGNFIKSFTQKGPVAARYRTMAATLLGSYVTLNIANKLTSGHFAYENDPGHAFELESGYTPDGQKRYIRPYGTAADFIRLPADILVGITKGDYSVLARTIRNRLSTPLAFGVGFLTDTDYRGKPVGWKGTNQYGQEMPLGQRAAGIAGEVSQAVGFPSFLQQGLKTASGQQGVEQGLLQGFELPVRYSGGAYSKSQVTAKGVGQAGGLEGKELYDLNKTMQGITLTKNQAELLRQQGIKVLPDILQLKNQNHLLNEVKKIQGQIQDGTIDEVEGIKKINDIVNNASAPQKKSEANLAPTVSAAGPTNAGLKAKLDEQLARTKVQTTGQSFEANGKYFYTNTSGNVSSVPLDRTIYQPKLTGNPQLDKLEGRKLIESYTSKINDTVILFEQKKLNAAMAEEKITQLLNEQKTARAKFGKGKKLRIKKIPFKKMSMLKVKKFKPVKVPKMVFKPLKPTKLKTIKSYTGRGRVAYG